MADTEKLNWHEQLVASRMDTADQRSFAKGRNLAINQDDAFRVEMSSVPRGNTLRSLTT